MIIRFTESKVTSDPDPYQSQDPDPSSRMRIHHHGCGSADPDPHQNDTDPKHWFNECQNLLKWDKTLCWTLHDRIQTCRTQKSENNIYVKFDFIFKCVKLKQKIKSKFEMINNKQFSKHYLKPNIIFRKRCKKQPSTIHVSLCKMLLFFNSSSLT